MYIYLGGPMSGRSEADAEGIAIQMERICCFLNQKGHTHDGDMLIELDLQEDYDVPQHYMDDISDAAELNYKGIRIKNTAYESLKEELAEYRWMLDLFKKAGACIWYLPIASTGCGFEIALALQFKKPCLVLVDEPRIAASLNGCRSRYLMIQQTGEHLEAVIDRFLKKVERGYDRKIRFNVTNELGEWLDKTCQEKGYQHLSDYLRDLLEKEKAMY